MSIENLKTKLIELEQQLLDCKNTPDNIAKLYAFYTKYSKQSDSWQYPSYDIAIDFNTILNYSKTMLAMAQGIISKLVDIKPFSYSNDKSTIDYIDLSKKSEYTQKIEFFLEQIHNSSREQFSSIKAKANCIAVCLKNGQDKIIIITKGALFKKENKLIFSYIDEDSINPSFEPIQNLFKLPLSMSAIIINNEVFLLTNIIGSIFGFENSIKLNAKDSLAMVSANSILTTESFSLLETYSNSGKNYYRYMNFDKSKIDAIKNSNPNILSRIKKKGITSNKNGELVLDTDDKVIFMQKLLCNDLKSDIADFDTIYDAPGNNKFN